MECKKVRPRFPCVPVPCPSFEDVELIVEEIIEWGDDTPAWGDLFNTEDGD